MNRPKRKNRSLRQARDLVSSIVHEDLQELGLLPEWHLFVEVVPRSEMEDKEADAEIGWPRSYRTVYLRVLDEHARSVPEEELRRTLRHELLHLIFAPLREAVEGLVGWDTTATGRCISDAQETVIERIMHLMLR